MRGGAKSIGAKLVGCLGEEATSQKQGKVLNPVLKSVGNIITMFTIRKKTYEMRLSKIRCFCFCNCKTVIKCCIHFCKAIVKDVRLHLRLCPMIQSK